MVVAPCIECSQDCCHYPLKTEQWLMSDPPPRVRSPVFRLGRAVLQGITLHCDHKGAQVCCRVSGACRCMSEHVSHAAVVMCAGVAAGVPPTQQTVFSQHTLPSESRNALVYSQTVCSCIAHPLACCESAVLLFCPSERCSHETMVSPTFRNRFCSQFSALDAHHDCACSALCLPS